MEDKPNKTNKTEPQHRSFESQLSELEELVKNMSSSQLDLEKALFFLYKAQDFDALPTIDEILQDSWIDNLKSTPAFQALIEKLEAQKE